MWLARLLVLAGIAIVALATNSTFARIEAAETITIAAGAAASTPAGRGGDAVHHVFSIEGKQVPLPPGEWIVAGEAPSSSPAQVTARPPMVSVVLVRLKDKKIDAAILVQTNRLRGRVVWGTAASCYRADLYFARTRYSSDHDGSCAYAAFARTNVSKGVDIDQAWTNAMQTAAAKGWSVPTSWVDVVVRITDPRDAIQVRYLFDPWGQSDLTSRRLSSDSIQSLTDWAQATWDVVETGFGNRIDDDAGPRLLNWPRPELGGRDSDADRPSRHPDQPAIGPMGHLGVKMVTYRIFGTMTDLTVNYLWLGSLPSAGGLAIIGAVASSSLYFVHELVWSQFEKPTEVAITLPGVGEEGPQSARN